MGFNRFAARLAGVSAAVMVAFFSATAIADLVVKDGNGASKTIKNFICETTKLCNATVLIKSDGTEIGTASAPVRTDPTGTTTQPVSGTVTANIGSTGGIALDASVQSILTTLGLVATSPTANTLQDRLKTVNTSLGTVNTSLGTINTTLGSPFQAGGSIGNSAFGIVQGGNTAAVDTAGADDVSNTKNAVVVYARPSWYDGATWDRAPGNSTQGMFATVGQFSTNPTATFTRPSNTTAYTIGDLVNETSVAAKSITVTRFATGSARVTGLCVTTPKTSGMDTVQLRVRLWRAAPTYSINDNDAYAITTGAANYLGKSEVMLEQFADGATGCAPIYERPELRVKLASGSAIYADIQTLSAFTPASAQTFTVTLDNTQD